jgi:hypothetical protein
MKKYTKNLEKLGFPQCHGRPGIANFSPTTPCRGYWPYLQPFMLNLTSIIGYAEHFVVHHTYQIYSLGLMRAKAVGSKNRSETELDGVKMINSMIRN